jgi:hypothetical protein
VLEISLKDEPPIRKTERTKINGRIVKKRKGKNRDCVNISVIINITAEERTV